MDAIKEGTCVCCHMRGLYAWRPEIHHLLSGNKRRGHMFTVGLCAWHHRGAKSFGRSNQDELVLGPSLANGSKPFHAAFFGSDDAMLEYQNKLLAEEKVTA